MKKMLMGMLAMLLVLTMGTTVFAANSPGTDAALDQKAQEWVNNVKNVTVKGTNNTIYNVTKKKVDASKVTSVNEAANSVNASAKVLAMADLSVGDNVDTSKGVTITLSIDPTTISSGYSVYVLHQYGNGKWEVVKPSSVSNGQVTVTLYSLSPVAVVQYPTSANVPTSDPSKNQPDGNKTNNNTNSTENNTNSNNTSGPSQSNSNSSNSNSSNSNNQSNNQNNPVNVNQNVTVKYPEKDSEDNYDEGYNDGYSDGRNSVKGSSASNGGAASGGTTSAGVLSPKTGASLPALPIAAVFALAGVAVCGRKAHANR
jgi:hypothetical protein